MIACRRHVCTCRLDVPERRINRVVFGHLIDAIGEVVWQQPSANPRRKGAQHCGANLWSARCQRQTAQGDRRVAPPVVEPGVAGDHRPAEWCRRIRWPGRGGNASSYEEVISGKNQCLHLSARSDRRIGTVTNRLRTGEQIAIARLTLGEKRRPATARHRGEELSRRSTDAAALCGDQKRGALARLKPNAPAQRNGVVRSVRLNASCIVPMEEATNHPSVGGECAAVAADLHLGPRGAHSPRTLLRTLNYVRLRAR